MSFLMNILSKSVLGDLRKAFLTLAHQDDNTTKLCLSSATWAFVIDDVASTYVCVGDSNSQLVICL